MTNRFDANLELRVRLKVNQKNPLSIMLNRNDLKEDALKLRKIQELLYWSPGAQKLNFFQDVDLQIWYLDESGDYLKVPAEGIAISDKKSLELYIDQDLNLMSKLDRLEHKQSELALRIDAVSKDLVLAKHSSLQVDRSDTTSDAIVPMTVTVDEEKQPSPNQSNHKSDQKFSPFHQSYPDLELSKSASAAPKLMSMGSKKMSKQPHSKPHLPPHFAILYSNPLLEIVQKKNRTVQSIQPNDPVDFYGESTEILRSLASKNVALRVHIECATAERLGGMIEEKPSIMHIMCHGDYDVVKKEYFLEFENSRAELSKLYPSLLKEKLGGKDLSDIHLIFINACHSQAIGECFLEMGVKAVVVAQSEHKINDEFAKMFSNYFYTEIIEGKPIGEAYKNAKSQLKSLKLNAKDSCCCGHSHKPTCKWLQEYKKLGGFVAHAHHEAICNCPERANHIHSLDCEWADDFNYEYECEGVQLDGDRQYICCCCPDLTHDETMKLQLLWGKQGPLAEPIFRGLPKGEITQENKVFFAQNKFQDCETTGNNKLLHSIFNAYSNENVKIGYLIGETGSGKTTLSKHLANYMTERHKIDSAHYNNMDKVRSVDVLLATIPGYRHFNKAEYKNRKTGEDLLVIFDNMDSILLNHFVPFRKGIQEILDKTKMKFLVLSSTKDWVVHLKNFFQDKVFELQSLNTQAAAKLLKFHAKENLPWRLRNILNLEKHDIFVNSNRINLRLTPKTIMDIAFLLKKKGKDLDTIYRELSFGAESKDRLIQEESYEARKNFLNKFQENLPGAFRILVFISEFPYRILSEDLKDAAKVFNFAADWLATVIYLTFLNENKSFEAVSEEVEAGRLRGKNEVEIYLEHKHPELNKNTEILTVNEMLVGNTKQISFALDEDLRRSLAMNDQDFLIIFEATIQMLEYYCYLFGSIIKHSKLVNFYHENIVECCANNSTVLWSLQYGLPSNQNLSYIVRTSTSDRQEIIKMHDSNIRILMNEASQSSISNGLQRALRENDENRERYISVINEFFARLWSICKIHEQFDEALEYLELFRQLNSTEATQNFFRETSIKSELFGCDIYYKKLKKGRDGSFIQDIITQLTITEKTLGITTDEEFNFFQTEYQITRYYIFSEEKMKWPEKEHEVKDSIENLITYKLKIENEGNEEVHQFLVAKIVYVVFEYYYEKSACCPFDFSELKTARLVFGSKESHKLECKTLILLASLYSNKFQESLNFAKEALEISEKFNIKELERQIKILIDTANNQIREQFQNKFYYLKSDPMRGVPKRFGGLNFSKFLRHRIQDELVGLKKNILIHFDRFNTEVFKELFVENKGCKLLAVDFLYSIPEALALEESDFSPLFYDVEILRTKLGLLKGQGINVEILVCLSDNPDEIFEKFAIMYNIPVLIYFDTKMKPRNNFDIATQFLNREYMYNFLIYFTKEICKGTKVQIAIDNANKDCLEYLNFVFTQKQDPEIHTITGSEPRFKTKRLNLNFNLLESMYKDTIKVVYRRDGENLICNLVEGSRQFIRLCEGNDDDGHQRHS